MSRILLFSSSSTTISRVPRDATMSENLPDEVISEILSPVLKVPDRMFSDTSYKSPFASNSVSTSSSTLLVCKSWLRVASPLLYSTVIIRSKAQAQALQRALQSVPQLGRFVKKLRVEGGFGMAMHKILQSTPNVSDILVSLQLPAADPPSGLASGLPLINPTRLIILDEHYLFVKNKAVSKLIDTLETCVVKWTNLHTIQFPYSQPTDRQPFCTALCTAATTAKILSFPVPKADFVPYLTKIAQIPSLTAIEIRTDSAHDETPPFSTTTPVSASCTTTLTTAYKSPSCAAIDPSFRPMASIPQPTIDRIWSRILSFAMLSLEQHPENTDPWKLPDPKVNSSRLQFLLVSKLFYRLASPHLHRYPIFFRESNFSAFLGALATHPAHGSYVRTLDLRQPPERDPLARLLKKDWPTKNLDAIFPHTSNLTHLIGGGRASISWDAFTTLAEIAGGTLQEFNGFRIDMEGNVARSPKVLRHLVALRAFGWDVGFSVKSKGPSPFGAVDEITAAGLPALEFVCIKSPEVLPVFSKMQLPSLRRATFKTGEDGVNTFLEIHGPKLQLLEVESATIANKSVLPLCPNITTLTCHTTARSGYDLGSSPGFQHAFLHKIVVSNFVVAMKAYEREWEGFFATVDTTHLPALREVSFTTLRWPTNEKDISKSMWVKGAAILLERGIKLTDEAGVEWRPRLKSSRSKGKKQ
ncbi:hypothetical protein FB451DRAFT_1433324 [Mycena latifolia]|nr:hypothetical protein FB451DRAFT_1433324 [Mycena latifolia]